MIKINDILKSTIFLLCGTVNEENDFEKINFIIQNNLNVLTNINNKILVLNKTENILDDDFNNILIYLKKTYNFIIIKEHINRGYQFGFIDEDLLGFNFIRFNLDYDYILKCNIDILIYNEFINLEFHNGSDLIYFPEITSLSKELYNDEYKTFKNKLQEQNILSENEFGAWNQPWLYLISKNINKIYDQIENLNSSHYEWLKSVNGNYKQWHQQNKVLCSEEKLIKSFLKKNYKKYCLIRDNNFDNYCEFIKNYNIGDATIKNICIKNYGICHFHNKNNQILEIII